MFATSRVRVTAPVSVRMEILDFSIESDSFSIHGEIKIYHWEKSNFLPDKNMVFTF